MNVPISVVIPCHKNPECLDLCLKSIVETQDNENQIVVVLDGQSDECEAVTSKYPVDVLINQENKGASTAHNYGVYMSECSHFLIVNDDNVFPRHWDTKLLSTIEHNNTLRSDVIVAPNQIEPTPSIFKSFIIQSFGRNPKEFDLEGFWNFEEEVSEDRFTEDGLLFPIFMSKRAFMTTGGFDTGYPAKSGAVADWDFFLKCQLLGLKSVRYHGAHFYHFVSVVTQQDDSNIRAEKEKVAFDYFNFKWGYYPPLDGRTHSRYPRINEVRGVRFT